MDNFLGNHNTQPWPKIEKTWTDWLPKRKQGKRDVEELTLKIKVPVPRWFHKVVPLKLKEKDNFKCCLKCSLR